MSLTILVPSSRRLDISGLLAMACTAIFPTRSSGSSTLLRLPGRPASSVSWSIKLSLIVRTECCFPQGEL
jgi:hypothetical protein